jgi:hypothetical protein
MTIIISGTFGCASQSPNSSSKLNNPDPPVGQTDSGRAAEQQHKWLLYADPKADANFAMQNQDFQLLAFASRQVSIPGIEQAKLDRAKQLCGYRFLEQSGDTLTSAKQSKKRAELYEYAASYNILMLAACETKDQ